MNLDKAKLEAWLDSLIEGRRLLMTPYDNKLKSLECVEYHPAIHIEPYNLIPKIAEILGVEWYHEDDGTDYYPHSRWFIYKDIKFHALSKEEE